MKISPFEFRNPNVSNNRGVALVFVLWVFIFLFVAAFDFTGSVREEGVAAHRFAEESGGYFLALAGFEEGLYRLLANRDSGGEGGDLGNAALQAEEPVVFGEWREAFLGDGVYRFCLVDEGGKVNLNRANGELLRLIFTNLGIEEPRRSVLVDSILDWRDKDDLHRLNGAENDYYLSLGTPYTAKNGAFDTIEELLWVRGVTRDLFYGVEQDGTRRAGFREIFTVDGPQRRVNLLTVSVPVCQALLGQAPKECRKFIEERKGLSGKTVADLLRLLGLESGEAAVGQFTLAVPSVISIEAEGYHAGSHLRRRLRGVVRLIGGRQGFRLLRWVDWSGEPSNCEEA